MKEYLQSLNVSSGLLLGDLGSSLLNLVQFDFFTFLNFLAGIKSLLALLIELDLPRSHGQVDPQSLQDATLLELVAHDRSLLLRECRAEALHKIAIPSEFKAFLGSFSYNVCRQLLEVGHHLQIFASTLLVDLIQKLLIFEVLGTESFSQSQN